ncbi:MAG: hypothetical protein K8R35_04335 [Bacteroidales bacterium]|nr:hypothetical protein [Bacteroidales bacterium]
MVLRALTILILALLFAPFASAQKIIRAENLIGGDGSIHEGEVRIDQDQSIDTLLTRHIIANRNYNGFDGFRIQIFNGSGRTARDKANEAKANFILEFHRIESYLSFEPPNYFKVRVGDYRTRRDAFNNFLAIKKEFPNAYIVPDIIKFPDLGR